MARSAEHMFPRVREAREALKDKALIIFDLYVRLIEQAMAEKDFETAEKALRFLQEHMPGDEDGTRMLDQSVDKVEKGKSLPTGPTVNIGFKLGGITPKQLPEVVIEAEKIDE